MIPEFHCGKKVRRGPKNAEHEGHDCVNCRKQLPYNVPDWCTDEICRKEGGCGFEPKDKTEDKKESQTMDTEMQATIDEITKYGRLIGSMSREDEVAKQILTYYDMFYKCKEPGSFALLEAAFKKWKEAHLDLIERVS